MSLHIPVLMHTNTVGKALDYKISDILMILLESDIYKSEQNRTDQNT